MIKLKNYNINLIIPINKNIYFKKQYYIKKYFLY